MTVRNFHTNPFPGIRSYEIHESHHFFGREKQVRELIEKLARTRFLAIVGSSGCGKSSLIKAGLLPELFKSKQLGSALPWHFSMFRPAEDPLGNLCNALSDGKYDPEKLMLQLRSGDDGLVKAVSGLLRQSQSALIYIDQFEELFRFKRGGVFSQSASEAKLFIRLIIHAVEQTEVPVSIVLSMRTDFLDECTEFIGLSELINKGYYLVPRMNNDERRLAITGPVHAESSTIKDVLVERLLQDVGDDPDQLPILQHAMMRTWDHWTLHKSGDQPIDIEHYEAIGTMKEALSVHLEEIYAGLKDERSKQLTEKLFKALTDISNESRGTRRPTPLGEICTLTNAREEEIIRVIDQFRSPGCAFLMPSAHVALNALSTIDISHESIMRVWSRLKKWVEEEGESAQLYLRLSKSAALYQEGKTGLWINPELQLAVQWKDQNKPNITWAARYDPAFDRAMTFLSYSKKQFELEISKKENQQKRNLRRARISAIILGIASLVSILFLIVSLNLRFKAEASRKEAIEKEKMAVLEKKKTEVQRKEAIVQRKISEQQQQIAEQQELITEQQRQYAVKQQVIAQQQTTEAVQQRKQADVARHEALSARDEAQQQRKEAVAQKLIADQERVKAEESERIAQRLRLLAIANSMAIQALQLHSTVKDEIPALYALTAYQLHSDNGGEEGDPTLYSALSAISNDPIILRGHQDAVRAVITSADGKWLFSCGDDQKVIRWNIENPEKQPVFAVVPKEIKENFRSIMLTHDEKWLIAGTTGGKLIVWDNHLFPGSVSVVNAHESIVNSLVSSPVSNVFYSSGSDGKVLKWSYDAQHFKSTLLDQVSEPVLCSHVNHDGSEIVYAMASGAVKTLNLVKEPKNPSLLTTLKSQALSVKYQPGSNNLVFGCQDGSIQVFQINQDGFEQTALVGRHISGVNALTFSQDGSKFGSASYDWTIRLSPFPVLEEKPISIDNHELWIYDLLFTPGGDHLISCSADRTIRIFSVGNEQMAVKVRPKTKRNMTAAEWSKLVGEDIPYQKTIAELP